MTDSSAEETQSFHTRLTRMADGAFMPLMAVVMTVLSFTEFLDHAFSIIVCILGLAFISWALVAYKNRSKIALGPNCDSQVLFALVFGPILGVPLVLMGGTLLYYILR